MSRRAFTRAVSPRIAECQLTHLDRVPIDPSKAAAQHSAYEQALADAGYEILRLPELADAPDAVFVEDTAILLDGHAIITRPGAPSRIGETDSTAKGLGDHFDLHRIETGHLDGGDVLRVGRRLYVSLSTRTDRAGAESLAAIARPLGHEVVPAETGACLHLKTGATFAGDGILLYDPQTIDPAQFTRVESLAVEEPAAANCVRLSGRLILAAGAPRTADKLRRRGFTVVEVDVSELHKAEAGFTCMSMISD